MPVTGLLDERDAAARAVNLAKQDARAARLMIDALEADNTPANDVVLIGSRLRLLMALTCKMQAEAWLKITQSRGG